MYQASQAGCPEIEDNQATAAEAAQALSRKGRDQVTTPQQQGLTATSDYHAPDIARPPTKYLLSGLPDIESVEIRSPRRVEVDTGPLPALDEVLANRAAIRNVSETNGG